MKHTDTIEGYYPVGHLYAVLSGGVEVARRFVFDADVKRIAADLRRSYPGARTLDGFDESIRELVTLLGPEHPALIHRLADDLCLPEVRA